MDKNVNDNELEDCNIYSNRPTPILRGEDAKRFLKQLEENKNKKIDPEKIKRIRESYKQFQESLERDKNNG